MKRFTKDNGIVYDSKTGLEWFVVSDEHVTLYQARQKAKTKLKEGWRFPTGEELKTLYTFELGSRNMTPLLITTGWVAWSSKFRSEGLVTVFSFRSGIIRQEDCLYYYHCRCFIVRKSDLTLQIKGK